MKNFILSSIMFLSGFQLMAQAKAPLAPFPETPFSVNVKDKLTGEDKGRGNWAFEVRIKNDNDKPIRCLNTTFFAYLDDYDKHCPKANFGDYGTYINVAGSGKSTLDIPAHEAAKLSALIGYDERVGKEKETGLTLEFCGRDQWDLKCGFNCKNEKMFGDLWDEKIIGGTKKYRCEATGEAERTTDPVSCASGFTRDLVNDRCLVECTAAGTKPNADSSACEAITCPGNITIGQARVSDIFDGNGRAGGEKREVCLSNGFFDSSTVSCFEDFRKVGDSGCVHKSAYPEYYLKNQQSECSGPGAATSNECSAAASRWCSTNYGYNVGFIEQLAPDHTGVGCYHGSTFLVPFYKTRTGFLESKVELPNGAGWLTFFTTQRNGASSYCQRVHGMDTAILHEIGASEVAITCLKSDGYIALKPNESGCFRGTGSENTMQCRAEASNACVKAGFASGILRDVSSRNVEASCFRGGAYKFAPFVQAN